MCLATSNNLSLLLYIGWQQQKHTFSKNSWSSGLLKNDAKTLFFPILRHLSTVIFANATVMALVLLPSSRFNFHCYTQCEPTPTQKLTRKWQLWPFATSCVKDYEGHSLLQTSFTEPPNTANSMQRCTACGQHHRNWIATFLWVENHFLLGDTHRLLFIAVPYRKTQSTIWQRCWLCAYRWRLHFPQLATSGHKTQENTMALQKKKKKKKVTQWVQKKKKKETQDPGKYYGS